MKTWRLIDSGPESGAMQMAIDEAMLMARIENKVPNTLRFFSWKPACVSVGFFQDAEDEVDIPKVRSLNIDLVRRYTGGGAVFHESELTYSLLMSEQELSLDVVTSYQMICSGIIEALRRFDLEAEFKPINDIIVNGKKISGNAQTRKSGIVLQHGTVISDLNLEKMFSVLKVPDEKLRDKMIKIASERVTSVKNEIGRKTSYAEIGEALIYGFEKIFKIKLEKSELSSGEIKTAKKLYQEKYANDKWTHGR